MTSLEFLLCAALVSISAFMSSTEIALFSLSRFQLRALKEHLRPSHHKKIKQLLADPGGLLITILVLNELVNISLSTLITEAVSKSGLAEAPLFSGFPSWAVNMAAGTLVTAPVVLLLCEITPKVIGARANQLISSLSSPPMHLVYRLMKPVRVSLTFLVQIVSKWTNRGEGKEIHHHDEAGQPILKESDFMLMVEEGHKEGAIDESEMSLIQRVFELDDTTVEEVLKPLNQTLTLQASTSVQTALSAIQTQKYSRIPVVSAPRKVVGVLYSKDLLRTKMDPALMKAPVTEVMRKPLVVNQSLRLNSLFRKFKQERTHMAVVQGSNGDALGVVTMSDVLSAIFEDLLVEEDFRPVSAPAPVTGGSK